MILLSSGTSNTKLRKSDGRGFLCFGLSLRPSNLSGYNVCSHAGHCARLCVLSVAGRSCMPSVQAARDRKTRLLFEDRAQFIAQLADDIGRAVRSAKRRNLECAIRLNVASDLQWERIAPSLLDVDATYYDYTKVPNRITPDNYHLTYSVNETTDPSDMSAMLRRGTNCAVVFDTIYNPSRADVRPLPKRWRGHRVIDGDTHDLRLPAFDGSGVIVGLRGKGGRAVVRDGVRHGFIQRTRGGVMDVYGASDMSWMSGVITSTRSA